MIHLTQSLLVSISLFSFLGCKTTSNNSQTLDIGNGKYLKTGGILEFDPNAIQKAQIDGEPVAFSDGTPRAKYLKMYEDSLELLYNNPEVKVTSEERERRSYNDKKKVKFGQLEKLIKQISTPIRNYKSSETMQKAAAKKQSQVTKLKNLQSYYFYSINWDELKMDLGRIIENHIEKEKFKISPDYDQIEEDNKRKSPEEKTPLKKIYLNGLNDSPVYLDLNPEMLETNLNYAVFSELTGATYRVFRQEKNNIYKKLSTSEIEQERSLHDLNSVEGSMLKQIPGPQNPDDSLQLYVNYLNMELDKEKLKRINNGFRQFTEDYLLVQASRAMFLRGTARGHAFYTYKKTSRGLY